MLRLVCFGSGSSGNCYYLFNDNAGFLIDVGIGVRKLKKYFREFGLPMSRIMCILITHDHADHVKSVGRLSHDLKVPVYATKDVFQGIDGNYCVKIKVDSGLRHYIDKSQQFQIGDFKVTPFGVPHDSNDNVGYAVTDGNVNFCLITDAGHVTSEMEKMVSRANYLILESNHEVEKLMAGPYPQFLKERVRGDYGHLSNEQCAMLLARCATPALKHVWLCHLSEENNHPELARKTNETILRQHGIVAGTDFLIDILKRRSPSDIYELT